ncbi:MAG TPA: hypothetical protein VF167_10235 [Longimicrobiaceae bacterium]
MAELRVERKRPNVWRWIVLLLLIALLVWAIVELFGGEDSSVIESNPVGARSTPGVVAPDSSPWEFGPAGETAFA